MATLACNRGQSSRCFLFDRQLQLCGSENHSAGKQKMAIPVPTDEIQRMAFSGIHVIRPELLQQIEQTGAFSIIDAYLQLAPNNFINCFDVGHADIADVGKPEQLLSIKVKQNEGNEFLF
jgi:hypothetical protein